MRVEELRPVTAGRLLEIWQTQRECGADGLERCLLCNAQVLAESCYTGGGPVFANAWEALRRLSPREMEDLLMRLASGRAPTAPAAVNPGFDPERFARLREEGT